jgi:2-succinyl-6-hydroxy-2,4-cyclohexadiene-1-carboxylate synthase
VSGDAAHRIDAGGLALHAEIAGEGPPVVILHGFTGSARGMAGVAAGLEDTFRTIRIDLVGHGRSDAPRDPSVYTMPRCTAQLTRALDALGLGRAHLAGYSMGGRVALSLCAAHPERVISALLVGASAGIEDPRARAVRIRDDQRLAARIEREGVASFVDSWMSLPLFATQRRLGEEWLAEARAQRLSNRAHGLALSLRGMGAGAQPPLHRQLGDIDVPICLVAGERDAKFRTIAADLAGRLPKGRVEVIRDAGHAAHLERPAAFLRVARRWLAGVDADSRAVESRPAIPPAHAMGETTP